MSFAPKTAVGRFLRLEEQPRRLGPCALGEIAGNYVGYELVRPHRCFVAAPTGERSGACAAVNMGDRSMAEFDEVANNEPRPFVLVVRY